MKLAILHFHLRKGGVTRVIELACEALREQGVEVAVLAGDIPEDSKISELVPTRCVPGLDYQRTPYSNANALQLELEQAARSLLGGMPDIWHIHNHALGKNLALPAVVASWARRGEALLLQIHDFAENGRPENYKNLRQVYGEDLSVLYPCSSRVGYALLNKRDFQILSHAQFPGTILLPNPVSRPLLRRAFSAQDLDAESLVAYPCRAIRRKNIGEALLLACGFSPGERLALALGPSSPGDWAFFQSWQILAAARKIPVDFEVCSHHKVGVGDLLSAARCAITTSMEEGFGMAFLEPWLLDRPLIGRDIPGITSDFCKKGVDLGSLYSFLGVPVSVLGKNAIEQSLLRALEERFAAFGKRLEEDQREKFFHRALRGDLVDFGQLEPLLQAHFVELASESTRVAREILPELPSVPLPETILYNRKVIEEHYSLTQYGMRLAEIYKNLVSAPSPSAIFAKSSVVLEGFLKL